MKRKNFKLLILFSVTFFTLNIKAQLSDVTQMLNGGLADANLLTKAYLNPWGKDFAVGLGNGWFNTAKPHGFLPIPGFDITFMGTVTMVPTADQSFDISKLGLTSLQPANTNTSALTPTIAGSKTGAQSVSFKPVGGITQPPFSLPNGIGVSMVALPIVQVGIGLPFRFELDARYCPTINISKFGQLGLWGIGLKHDIKQWIPFISHVPFWDMSLQAAYTSSNLSTASGSYLTPDQSMYYVPNGYDLTQYNGQAVKFNAHAFVGNLLVSTDIPVINLYAGIGFTSASSTLKITGTFPTPGVPTAQDVINNGGVVKSKIVNKVDPINVNFNGNGMRATIGLPLRLAFLAIHADMTSASGGIYYTGGLGFSFR